MSEIYYNHALSTFSPVLIAGVLAMHSLPAISQIDMADQYKKSISVGGYRASTDAATYSHLSSLFTGEYNYAATRFERPWLTPELVEFLRQSSQVSAAALDYLVSAIRDSYGDVQIDAVMHTDPEEGWTKPVFVVYSGMEDFDKVMDLEDSFFSKAANNPALLAILPWVIVSQA